MQGLQQVILQQMAGRERREGRIVADLERMENSLAEHAVAESHVPPAAIEKGQSQPAFRGQAAGLGEHELRRAGRSQHRRSGRALPAAVFRLPSPAKQRFDLVRRKMRMQLEADFAPLRQLAQRGRYAAAMPAREAAEGRRPVVLDRQAADVPAGPQVARHACRGQRANQGPPRCPGGHGRFQKHQRPGQSRRGRGNAPRQRPGHRSPRHPKAALPRRARRCKAARRREARRPCGARPTAGRPASGLRRPRPVPGNGWREQSVRANRRPARPGPAATCSRCVARDRPRPARRPEARRSC